VTTVATKTLSVGHPSQIRHLGLEIFGIAYEVLAKLEQVYLYGGRRTSDQIAVSCRVPL
jgi:hypothetical protein